MTHDDLWDSSFGRILSPFEMSNYADASALPARPRSLQLTRYDPGSAVYRYHSAANCAPGGVSAFARFGHDNPYCDLRQYDATTDRAIVDALFDSADVVHVHMDYETIEHGLKRWPDRGRQMLVRHYHGSHPDNAEPVDYVVKNSIDDELGAVHIGARLYHQRFSARMHWLPIPMPVDDYAALRARHFVPLEERANKRIRIAHSPTHPRIKGTIVLETYVNIMERQGLPVELVMIQDKPQAEALALKATCDITFDSFWLGMQGSGLEAACMGQVVIAGDDDVRREYEHEIGYCPYTFTRDAGDFPALLEQLVLDADLRTREAARVAAYVREYHDYPTVGARYWSILQRELEERGYGST